MSTYAPPSAMRRSLADLQRALRVINRISRRYIAKLRNNDMRGYGPIFKRVNRQIYAAQRLSSRLHLVSCPTY